MLLKVQNGKKCLRRDITQTILLIFNLNLSLQYFTLSGFLLSFCSYGKLEFSAHYIFNTVL